MKSFVLRDTTFYILLFGLIFVSAGAAFLLIPMLLFLGWFGYLVTAILGLSIGLLVNHFIHDLDDLTKHHHAGIWLVIILSSILNFFIIYMSVPVNVSEHALTASTLFAGMFLMPNLISHIYVSREKINK